MEFWCPAQSTFTRGSFTWVDIRKPQAAGLPASPWCDPCLLISCPLLFPFLCFLYNSCRHLFTFECLLINLPVKFPSDALEHLLFQIFKNLKSDKHLIAFHFYFYICTVSFESYCSALYKICF